MKSAVKKRLSQLALGLGSLALATGCGSGGSAAVGGSTALGTNIVGQISANTSTSGGNIIWLKNFLHIRTISYSGCSVAAYTLTGSTAVATGTANADGTFTLSGGT